MRHRPRILVAQLVPICSDLPGRLREQGANVHVALSASEAAELVSAMPFDLVILLLDETADANGLHQRLRTIKAKPLVVCMTTESARLKLAEGDADLIVRSHAEDEARFPAIAMETASDHSRLRLNH